jgi:membrane protease YdiL (CAAX protease family)
MNSPSSFAILWLFLRTAVRRLMNSSALLQQRFQKGGNASDPTRTGTLSRTDKASRGSRLFGAFLFGSMIMGGVLLSSTSVVTLIESARLDEIATSPKIVLTNDDYSALTSAAATADEGRETAVSEAIDKMSSDWMGPWTKGRFADAAKKRFAADGLEGFVAASEETGYRGDFAVMSAKGRDRAMRSVGLYILLFNLASAGVALVLMNRSLAGPDPVLNWLLQFPVSRRVLFLARMIEQTFDTPIAFVNTILTAMLAWRCGMDFWAGFGISIASGLSVALTSAALRVATESVLLQCMGRKLRGTITAAIVTVANLVLLFAMLGNGAPATTQALTWLGDRAPGLLFWNPLAVGFGSSELLAVHRAAYVTMLALMSAGLGFFAVILCERLSLGGLNIHSESTRTDAKIATPRKSASVRWERFQGLIAKEMLQVVRKPEIMVQVLLSPLLILGILYLKDPDRTLGVILKDGGSVCATIFAVAAYVLAGCSSSILAIEFRTLWFLQTLPRSLADSIRTKSRFWGTIVLVPAIAVSGWALATQSESTAALALRIPFLIAYIALFAEICFGAMALGASVANESTVRFRRSMWFLPLLVTAECSAALYLGMIWSLIGTLVIMILVAFALRQRQVAELPWITEPSDAPPRQLDSAHALIALGAFIQLRDILGGIMQGTDLKGTEGLLIGFSGSAVLVFLTFLFWQWQSGIRALPMPRRGAVLQPTLAGMAVAVSVGFLWVGVLRQNIDIATSAHATLRLPTSLASIDHEAVMRMLAFLCVAPLFEEWLFRGLLYRGLRQSWGVAASVALSGLLFTVIHPAASSVGVATLAVVTALVYERTGRLAAPMAIHFVYNLTIMALWTASVA